MHAAEDFWGKKWRDPGRKGGGRPVVVYFQGASPRWECRTGWGRDVMNSPKEQYWTSDRKCDEAQRPPSAYQTDDFSLSDVVLALSTEVRLNDNAGSWRGGQVETKYLDKSMTAYLMHTKFSVLHRVPLSSFTLTWLASLRLAVCVYLARLTGCQPQVVHRIRSALSGFASELGDTPRLNFRINFLFVSQHIEESTEGQNSQLSMLTGNRGMRVAKERGESRFAMRSQV